MTISIENNIPLQKINADFLKDKNIDLRILREDLIHPLISGNKWRKLKYNLEEAKKKGFKTILTFGGAFSNHVAATAAAGEAYNFNTIGVIRGEKVNNSTLDLAEKNGMKLIFVSREFYRLNSKKKEIKDVFSNEVYSDCYVIPEGGSNALAVKGCAEIIQNIPFDFDIVCCASGTGGTISGVIGSTEKKVYGFPALKGGDFLVQDIERFLAEAYPEKTFNNWELITDYHFGGYAKVKPQLVDFVKMFKSEYDIVLDFVYTGKMLFGLFDRIKTSNQMDGKKIIVIHTGGLQGNKGIEERYGVSL